MRIEIHTSRLRFANEIKKLVKEKIQPLERFVKRFETRGEIVLYVEIARTTKHHKHGNIYYSEATMHVLDKKIRVTYSDVDINSAINILKDKLKLSINKYKNKLIQNRRKANNIS